MQICYALKLIRTKYDINVTDSWIKKVKLVEVEEE